MTFAVGTEVRTTVKIGTIAKGTLGKVVANTGLAGYPYKVQTQPYGAEYMFHEAELESVEQPKSPQEKSVTQVQAFYRGVAIPERLLPNLQYDRPEWHWWKQGVDATLGHVEGYYSSTEVVVA